MNSDFIEVSNSETSQNFHLYALEWTSNTMKIYFDDILVNEMNTFAPFNQDFFILLNLAMGGNLGGNIDPNFSQDRMEIDYVRVYQQSTLSDAEFSFDNQRINISPNPVEEVLTIVTSFKNETVKLIISDVTGREVMNQVVHMKDGMIQVDATSFLSGLYFGRLYFGDTKNKVIKFIKK
jgi:beta-glucanase (GH16 family)